MSRQFVDAGEDLSMSDEAQKATSYPSGLAAIEAAIAYGGALYDEAKSDDFNAAFDHIFALLGDAIALFMRKSFSMSAFVAITAIEETAKAHVAIFRKDRAEGWSKGGDPLRNHKRNIAWPSCRQCSWVSG